MRLTFVHTKYTCYLAYITSALINNFAPLLFLTFSRSYGLTVTQLGLLVTANFVTQMLVDFLGANFIDKIGYRAAAVLSNFLAAAGFWLMAFLPDIMPNKPAALLIATVVYAVGSGIIEVLISPMITALPTDKTDADMGMLHSFYCWGSVIVIALSSAFFRFFGTERWRTLTCLWTALPLLTMILFLFVPIRQLKAEKEKSSLKGLFSSENFILFMLLMTCTGASEVAIAQWASMFAEEGLGVSKTVGDLLGPCMFAVLMGTARSLYAIFGAKLDLSRLILLGSIGCIGTYLMTTLFENPLISLAGCALCGFFVAIGWPGVLSLASKHNKGGGTAMFGILALGGDIGCFLGPETVAVGSSLGIFASPVRTGLLCATIFPVIMFTVICVLRRRKI